MALVALVLDVRGRDRDAALSFLRSLVDLVEGNGRRQSLLRLDRRDRGRQRGLPVIDVANGADVYVGLGALEFGFAHFFLKKRYWCKLAIGIEPMTSPLPRVCSTN